MPNDFFENQSEYNLEYAAKKELMEEFEASDLTVYSSIETDSMPYGYSSIEDAPGAPQWETAVAHRFIEVWWSDYGGAFPGDTGDLEIRDVEQRWFIVPYYTLLERCNLYVDGVLLEHEDNGGNTYSWLNRDDLTPYEDSYNLSITARGSVLSASMILKAVGNYTLGESWDNGELQYSLSYEIDFDAMKPSAFTLIGQLVTFQNPDFGIPGVFGTILTYIIALSIWACIILLAYTIITKLIPTIQGGVEN